MGWTVGRAPSSPPFDFFSTIDQRRGLIYLTLNQAGDDYPQRVWTPLRSGIAETRM
jgi:hypothetical protein